MNTDIIFLVEMGLVFGLVLAFAVWELVKLRREQRADKARAETPPDKPDAD